MATEDQLRASDAEREAVAERLRDSAAEGRLDPDELERRVASAYSATTHGELARLTADLPARAAGEPVRDSRWHSERMRRRLASFITINLICIIIWLATGAEDGFWPLWVLVGTGISFVGVGVRAALGVAEPHRSDRELRRAERRELRRGPRP